jgi:hypothetical protein
VSTLRAILADARLFVTVTLLSLLIWLWAESESLRSLQVSPRLEAVAEQSMVEASLDGLESGGLARIALRGSTAGIDQVQRAMPGILRLTPGTPGVPGEPGEHTLSLREVLAQQQVFRQAGVTVEQVEPAQVRLRVVAMQDVKLPVTVESPSVEFEVPPAANPREVTVRIPAAMKLSDKYAAVAALDEAVLAEAREGERFRTNIKLVLPNLPDRRPDPQTVTLEFTLRRKLELHTEPSVGVLVCLPPDEADRWQVQLKESSVREVTVAGPRDLVQQVRDRKIQLQALLMLTADDLKNKVSSKAVTFATVPPGLLVSTKEPVVQFVITPRGG